MYHGYQSVQGGGSWNTAVLVRVYNLQHPWTDVSEYHKIFRNLRDSDNLPAASMPPDRVGYVFDCSMEELGSFMDNNKGTQRPNVSKYARHVLSSFLCALEACLVNSELP